MRRRDPGQAGFTLLEVLVATAITGIAVAALMSGFSGALRNLSRAEGHERALLMGRAQMNRLLSERGLRPGTLSGKWDGGYHWKAQVRPWDPAGTGARDARLLPPVAVIKLEVAWPAAGGERRLVLESAKYEPALQ